MEKLEIEISYRETVSKLIKFHRRGFLRNILNNRLLILENDLIGQKKLETRMCQCVSVSGKRLT